MMLDSLQMRHLMPKNLADLGLLIILLSIVSGLLLTGAPLLLALAQAGTLHSVCFVGIAAGLILYWVGKPAQT